MKQKNSVETVDKILNENYVSDVNYSVQHARWLLTILGIWSYVTSNPSRIEKYFAIFAMPFCSIWLTIFVVPIFCHVIIRDIKRAEFIFLLGPICFHVSNIMKHYLLIFRLHSIKFCIQHMKRDWQMIENQNDRDIMMKNLRLGRGLAVFCTICMYSGGMAYQVIMPLFAERIVNERNETVKHLPFPGSDIFIDIQVGHNYTIVFCGICLAGFIRFTVVTAICNVAASFVSHACGQIQIVMSRLESLVDHDENVNDIATIDDRIAFIIRLHVRALRFSSKVEEVLREICLIEVVASTFIICMLEYYCMTQWKRSSTVSIITYMLLLISLTLNMFIFCRIGELLKDQCERVGIATYMIDWYRLPRRASLGLIMIIAMSNFPRKLTAGRIMDMSIYSFGYLMKTSLGYLNMVRAVAD